MAAQGNVYVFNATPQTVTLILNNALLTAGLTGTQQGNGYAPNSFKADRNPSKGDPGVAEFGGENELTVSFDGGGSKTYEIDIPQSEFPLPQDLQLYVFFDTAVLISPSENVTFSGQAVMVASNRQ